MGQLNGGGGGFFGGMAGGASAFKNYQDQSVLRSLMENLNQGTMGRSWRGLPTGPMEITQTPSMGLMPGGPDGAEMGMMPGLSQGPMQGPMPPIGGTSFRNNMMGMLHRYFPQG